MNKNDVLAALTRMREFSTKRNFEQSVDFGINFTGIDFKKPENRVDVEVTMPNSTGKQGTAKPLVFVRDKTFAEQLKGKARVILESEITEIKPKMVDQLIHEYNVFLAEGPSILTVAKHLGQYLAPKGKMPKPISADLQVFDATVSKISTSVKVSNTKGKNMPLVHVMVGKEHDSDEKIAENVLAIFNSVVGPGTIKQQNVKSSFVKLTMGPAIKVGLSVQELELLKARIEAKSKKSKTQGSALKGERK